MRHANIIHPLIVTIISWAMMEKQTGLSLAPPVVFSKSSTKRGSSTGGTSNSFRNYAIISNSKKDDDDSSFSCSNRRSLLLSSSKATFMMIASGLTLPLQANAATDCLKDCVKECKAIAPKDPVYCDESCREYCAQEDRNDGLSGSKSSTGGETGILGTSTVIKGEDKPPSIKLPGLSFDSEKGRKLIGY